MDFAGLSDSEIDLLAGNGRTTEEQITARRLLRRRRTRERRRQGWTRKEAYSANFRAVSHGPYAHASNRWAEAGDIRPSRFDRRALEALCLKEGWADMPSESGGDLALFVWCVARGLYDRPGIRQLL